MIIIIHYQIYKEITKKLLMYLYLNQFKGQ